MQTVWQYIQLILEFVQFAWKNILVGIAVAAFFIAWRRGHLFKLGNYVDETKVELRKCTWPTREELKGSTVVVIVSTGIVAIFTVGVDFFISQLVIMLNKF